MLAWCDEHGNAAWADFIRWILSQDSPFSVADFDACGTVSRHAAVKAYHEFVKKQDPDPKSPASKRRRSFIDRWLNHRLQGVRFVRRVPITLG
jgi:hypothetical protein